MKLSTAELVFAIGHEVGNHLGGVRLQAHLLDEDLDARELAAASVLIDDLAGRCGPLLALIRPLLADVWREGGGTSRWSSLLDVLERQVREEGTRGTQIEFAPVIGDDRIAPGYDWVHPLLVTLIGETITHAGRDGNVRVCFATGAVDGPEGTLEITDDGVEERLDEDAAARGRALAVKLAGELVGRLGGRVEADRDGTTTRVRLVFPLPVERTNDG